MKTVFYTLVSLGIIMSSCGGAKKTVNTTSPQTVIPEAPKPVIGEPVIEEPVVAELPVIEEPVKEIEEKLVPVREIPPAPDKYFVIIGSFRNYDNAVNYQGQIKKDGFSSVLLKNEKGLHRISVMGTNDISTARAEIKRIRTAFPKYYDTWLLIQAN